MLLGLGSGQKLMESLEWVKGGPGRGEAKGMRAGVMGS